MGSVNGNCHVMEVKVKKVTPTNFTSTGCRLVRMKAWD
jgi:hypothetical protein